MKENESKNEWRQPKIIRTTILQGGAEMAGGRVASFPGAGNARGSTMAGRMTPSYPQAGSVVSAESSSVTNVARVAVLKAGLGA